MPIEVDLSYSRARSDAEIDANRFQRPMGIEKITSFGKPLYVVRMIPKDPAARFGWELRCEVVEPTSNA